MGGINHMGFANGADSSPTSLAAGPGLQNLTGEYNCFLNVVVQCLWHCRAFHKGFMGLPLPIVQVCFTHAQLRVRWCSLYAPSAAYVKGLRQGRLHNAKDCSGVCTNA